MWRSDAVSMTHTWEHHRLGHEVERVTGRSTTDWFQDLGAWDAKRKGMIRAIRWLEDEHQLPHLLATTLAWNYFNPIALPDDIARKVARSGVLEGDGKRHPRFREARVRRAAHTVARRKKPAARKATARARASR